MTQITYWVYSRNARFGATSMEYVNTNACQLMMGLCADKVQHKLKIRQVENKAS